MLFHVTPEGRRETALQAVEAASEFDCCVHTGPNTPYLRGNCTRIRFNRSEHLRRCENSLRENVTLRLLVGFGHDTVVVAGETFYTNSVKS